MMLILSAILTAKGGTRINEEVLTRSANSFELKLSISRNNSHDDKPAYSTKIDINDRVVFQAMFWNLEYNSVKYFVKFTKTHLNDKLSYKISTSHSLANDEYDEYVVNRDFTTADDSWRSVADNIRVNCASAVYTVKFETKISPLEMSYASIHEDTDLTDLELRGVDGAVRMHKVVAAACSQFFKTLFMGSWRETAGGIVEVPDTSVTTLQYLKDYMYLGKVPESNDLRQLLLLSSCYMISDLELRCVYELSRHATTETAYDLIDFAVKHKQYKLLFAILQMMKYDDLLSLDAMKDFYNC